jgi:hypothetical protein
MLRVIDDDFHCGACPSIAAVSTGASAPASSTVAAIAWTATTSERLAGDRASALLTIATVAPISSCLCVLSGAARRDDLENSAFKFVQPEHDLLSLWAIHSVPAVTPSFAVSTILATVGVSWTVASRSSIKRCAART